MYSKRPGTSGMSGPELYKTKLISLIYLRAIHDERIDEFQLASNLNNMGQFDEIYFKAKVKDLEKPVAVFIQAQHREIRKVMPKVDLAPYFDSYLNIRQQFNPNNRDNFFKGTYDETECLFVIYTHMKVDFSDDSVESGFPSTLNGLMDTGGMVQRPYKSEAIREYIVKTAIKDQIISLAVRIAKFIMNKENFGMMLTDELLQRYHVILARKVFDVSEIRPEGHRVACFRHEFFETNEENLILFKDILYKAILKRRTKEPADINKLLSEFLDEPTDAFKLSKIIGTAVTYNYGELELDKRYRKGCMLELNNYVSQSTVNEAMELAAKEMLLSPEFELRVPAAFGNKDLTIRGSDEKINKRINFLVSRISDMLPKCESSKMVTINESMYDGFLQLNGGLAGAIGNIFVLDDNPKLMKITDNTESLGPIAMRLFGKLNDNISNLHEYKFYFEGNRFPKLSFHCRYGYEENLATDFLTKLLFYSNQADNDGMEKVIKNEIEDYQRDQSNYFQAKTDVIFLSYYDEIKKWWQLTNGSYLTRESDLFQRVINLNIFKDPMLTIINTMYMNKIAQFNYTFTEEAVRSLSLQDQHSSTVIIAENTILTVVKVMQYLKNKEHVVLDLEYIVNLPTNDRNALSSELRDTNSGKVLIFVCDKMQHSRNEKKILEYFAEVITTKKNIIITNPTSIEILQYFPKADRIIHDKKLSLIDLSKESQERIFETATVEFGFVEMRLDLLLKGWPMTGSSSQVDTPAVASATGDKPTVSFH